MDMYNVLNKWATYSDADKLKIRLSAIVNNVADSMAMEDEPVSDSWIIKSNNYIYSLI